MKVVIDEEKLMDLIEIQWGYEGIREDVQRVLRENSVPYEEEVPNYAMGYQDGVRKVLKEVAEGKHRPQGEWILVSERLPEGKTDPHTNDFEIVLCTTIWEDVRPYRFGKRIGENKAHFWLCGGIMDKYITAWQPLPEPYKRGDDDEQDSNN